MPGPLKTVEIMAKNEKRALLGVVITFVVWWMLDGRKRYGMKGMKG